MRTSFHLVQFFSSSEDCGKNLVEMAKVGGHEDIFHLVQYIFQVRGL
jgi:hypothetical protein